MKTFVITGGGTGGHLAIAKALAEALKSQGDEAVFIGSTSGQDRMWFESGSEFVQTHFLPTTGVVNKKGAAKLFALWQVLRAAFSARRIIRRYGACGVISVGGFSAAPASFAALSLGRPLFIHEQNAVTGRLNRLLKPRARLFFSSYDPDSPVKSYPVNKVLSETARRRKQVQTVIFLGGSQGARAINDFALETAPMLRRRGIRIIHQCGERDFDRVEAAYKAAGIVVELYAFTRNLPDLLRQSDLAVSRAGASTLWELAANALPALFVPYPYAAGDHQYHNAKFLADAGAGWLAREPELTPERLESVLDTGVEEASGRLLRMDRSDGAAEMVQMMKKEC